MATETNISIPLKGKKNLGSEEKDLLMIKTDRKIEIKMYTKVAAHKSCAPFNRTPIPRIITNEAEMNFLNKQPPKMEEISLQPYNFVERDLAPNFGGCS